MLEFWHLPTRRTTLTGFAHILGHGRSSEIIMGTSLRQLARQEPDVIAFIAGYRRSE